MGQNTSIEWTGSTWNPIRARLPEAITLQQIGGAKKLEIGRWGYHCEHVSPGCVNCYAEAMNKRTLPAWGTGLAFNVPNRLRVEIFLDEKELVKPLHRKRPTKIFPCSMTDLFAEFVSDEMIDRIFAVMALCPQHTFQLLSKRAARMRAYCNRTQGAVRIFGAAVGEGHLPDYPGKYRVLEDGYGQQQVDVDVYEHKIKGLACFAPDIGSEGTGVCDSTDCHVSVQNAGLEFIGLVGAWPLPNVHLGVSVEDQQRADERIPHLLQTPAAVRWVSYEPALGPVDFTRIDGAELVCMSHGPTYTNALTGDEVCPKCGVHSHRWYKGIDWGVYGGESGRGARPNDIAWARSFIRQFHAANLPAFMKQLGAKPIKQMRSGVTCVKEWSERVYLKDRKGGDMEEWEPALRVREMPQ